MKAKFYSIDANGKQILNHTPADFEITENGEPRDVISVSCPEQKEEPFSVVIAIDISGSMSGERIQNSKEAIKSFIDLLPDNGSEIALIAFNSSNFYISDFSTKKSQLKSKVESLIAGGGTNFNAAFINPMAGALLAINKAKYPDKNIVLVTDGFASGNEAKIINAAKTQNTRIFSIIIGDRTIELLQNISNTTNGRVYNEIISQDEFNEAFVIVANEIQNLPCEIVWESQPKCTNKLELIILNKSNLMTFVLMVNLSEFQTRLLVLSNNFINMGEFSLDTSIIIQPKKAIQIINDISFKPDLGLYEVLTPLPLIIKKNNSGEIKIRYTSLSSDKLYTLMSFESEYCVNTISLLSGEEKQDLTFKSLEVVHPNGGEVFLAGSDSKITWKGVSENEKVRLSFSPDNGNNWTVLDHNAVGLIDDWLVSNKKSDNCLIRVDQIIKDDNPFELEWSKNYGGSFPDQANSIIQTSDGGYVVAGYSQSYDGDVEKNKNRIDKDCWVFKVDSLGMIVWSKTFGTDESDVLNSVFQTSDGGYFLISTSQSFFGLDKGQGDCWILKLDSAGELEWTKNYGGTAVDYVNSATQTFDGGYLIVGVSNSIDGDLKGAGNKGKGDSWILKLNESGGIEWSKTYGGSGDDSPNSATQTFDGGYLIVGVSNSIDGDLKEAGNKGRYDSWVLKLNESGGIEWSKTYGGSDNDNLQSVKRLLKGGYIIVGDSRSNDGDLKEVGNKGKADYWILKLDDNGEIEWSKTYGGSESDYAINSIINNQDEIIVLGSTFSYDRDLTELERTGPSDIWILKLLSTGELVGSNVFGSKGQEIANSTYPTKDKGFIIAGYVRLYTEHDSLLVMKFAPQLPPLQSDTSDAVFSIIMPEPVIQNNDIDMGQMIDGSTKDTIVSSVICNTGDAPLHVLGVDITGGDAGDFLIPRGAGDFYLAKDSCQDMMFEFTPSALGNRTAVATIRTTIGDFTDTINIRGVGIDPVIEATAEVVDFGVFELGEDKDTTVVLVKNVGTSDITITDTRLSGPDTEQFSLNTAPISYTISAGEEKEFQLNYTAKYGGKTNSFLDFHYDGIGSPIRSLLFAEGIGGEVYPQVPDAYVGEAVELGIFLGKIKPEGLIEIATNFSATVSYNSTLLAPIDKSIQVTSEDNKSYIKINGELSGVPQIAAVPMKVGLGTAVKSGLVITEFQLYNANGDSVDYDIEPGVGEFNVLGICEEGGLRLINPNGQAVDMVVTTDGLNSNARINLTLIETGQTDLVIFDQIGNKIETVYSGTPSAGQQEINLDLSKYTNGRYYIKLTTPTITKTEIIEVVR